MKKGMSTVYFITTTFLLLRLYFRRANALPVPAFTDSDLVGSNHNDLVFRAGAGDTFFDLFLANQISSASNV